MLAAQPTEDEEERLQALQDLNILDTPGDEAFDRVTRLAALVFGVPIAIVSLVDKDRQWFKSCVGLDVTETGRDVSFCGHAIQSKEPFVVPDATKDPRFADNPLVTGPPYVRFYVGRPLAAPSGHLIGTLCLIDTEPRKFGRDEINRLEGLARWVEHEILTMSTGDAGEIVTMANRDRFWSMSKDILCVAGLDGYFKDVSPSLAKILDRSPENLLSQPFPSFVHPDDVAATLAELERLSDGEETIQFHNRFRHKDGTYRWFNWTAVPHGRVIFAVGRDVTEEKGMNDRLGRVMHRLQDRNGDLQEFTRIVSHDLRAPVRRARTAHESGDFDAIRQELGLLDKMIDDLVAYQHVSLLDAPMEQVELGLLWEEILDGFSAELKDAEVHTGALADVQGDPDQIGAVLRNLVDNSVKYADSTRPLSISIDATRDVESVTINYRDNGRGISPDQRANLWVPFQGRRNWEGAPGEHEEKPSGMGLPTVRRILQRHGGKIRAADPEEGAHFIIELPRGDLPNRDRDDDAFPHEPAAIPTPEVTT